MWCGGKEIRILSGADMGVNPKELSVYSVRGCGGFEGFKLYWSAPSMASWLSASLVLETWPAFGANGPLLLSWPG